MLEKLRAALKATTDKMQLIISRSDNGFSAEDRTEFDALTASSVTQKQDLQRAEIAAGLVAEVGSSAGRRTDVTGGANRAAADPWAGFAGAEEFYRAVRANDYGTSDNRLDVLRAAAGANQHGEHSQYGFLAPPQLSSDLLAAIDELDEFENLAALCNIEPSNAALVKFDRDEYVPWSSGGVTARRRDEFDAMTAQKTTKPQQAQLEPHGLYVYVEAGDELLADAPRMLNRLTVQSANAIVHKQNTEIMEGTGVGQMAGILTAANTALISVAKVGGQAADTIVKGNIDGVWNRVTPRAKRRGFWMCGAGVLSAIEGIYQANTNLFMPEGGITELGLARLRGRPVVESEYLPELGEQNDLIFVDLQAYKIIERQSLEYATSMHILFDRAAQAFRWTKRINGMPRIATPISRNKAGSGYTVSPFVRLEARA
jgi:HK97 family phage major capsid protein